VGHASALIGSQFDLRAICRSQGERIKEVTIDYEEAADRYRSLGEGLPNIQPPGLQNRLTRMVRREV